LLDRVFGTLGLLEPEGHGLLGIYLVSFLSTSGHGRAHFGQRCNSCRQM
jgi:hypothetical protein